MLNFQSYNKVFIYVDADSVGDLLELHLLNGNVKAAEYVHNSVQNAMQRLRSQVLTIPSAEILFVGCDDVLFSISTETYQRELVDQLRVSFYKESCLTMSGGVGLDVAGALISLRRAKLAGRDRVVETLK